jgi:hypothetical protein
MAGTTTSGPDAAGDISGLRQAPVTVTTGVAPSPLS